jgi:replicative DNA helicase
MFLFRPEYYASAENRQEMEGQAELIVAKQRNGPTGVVNLHFHKAYTRFDSAVAGHGQNAGGNGFGP